jgi:hypothetical protein
MIRRIRFLVKPLGVTVDSENGTKHVIQLLKGLNLVVVNLWMKRRR